MTNSTSLASGTENLTLGKAVSYIEKYTPDLLQAVPRSLGRDTINITGANLPFHGVDMWTGYELSWLNEKGKPNIALLHCEVPVTSPNLIESKSFKLYLNSFNQSVFTSQQQVAQALTADLSACAGAPVNVKVITPNAFEQQHIAVFKGTLLDELDIEVTQYQPSPALLNTTDELVNETLVSHLLKSNCLITQQPDWASIQIKYTGNKICHDSLLKYLVSFRQHNEFHEQCIERVYCDLMNQCNPEKLTVYARYTRRGGLDINPFRSNFESAPENCRLARQ